MFCCIACLMTTIVVLFIVLVPKVSACCCPSNIATPVRSCLLTCVCAQESSRPVTVAQEFDGNYARRTFITVMLGICALVSGVRCTPCVPSCSASSSAAALAQLFVPFQICLLNHFCMVKRQGSRVRDDDRFGLVIV